MTGSTILRMSISPNVLLSNITRMLFFFLDVLACVYPLVREREDLEMIAR